MRSALALVLSCLFVGLPLVFGDGAAAQACLSAAEQQQEVRAGRVVRPGQLGRSLGGNVLRMELCRGNGGLVWNVTVLGRDGRVVHQRYDARTGQRLR
jgi:hypothetical protein